MKDRSEKKRRLEAEDDSIDSDALSGEENEIEEDDSQPILSAEEKRMLLAQEYLEKMGLKYDGSSDLQAVVDAMGIADPTAVKCCEIAGTLSIKQQRSIKLPNKHKPTCCAVSLDDKHVFVGAKDGRISRWNLADDAAKPEYVGSHETAVTSICLCYGGRVLASGSIDGKIKLWDVQANRLLSTTDKAHKSAVNGLVSALGDSLFSISDDKSLRQWAIHSASTTPTAAFYGHTEPVKCIDALSSSLLLTGAEDCTLRFWNTTTNKHAIFQDTEFIDACAFLNKHAFLSAGPSGTLKLWSISKKKPLQQFGLQRWITAVAVCANTDLAVTGDDQGQLTFWRATTDAKKSATLEHLAQKLSLDGIITHLAFSKSGRYLTVLASPEPRFGRWTTAKQAKSQLFVVELDHSFISHLFDK